MLFCHVSGQQLSTNNGLSWFGYDSPLELAGGTYGWTSRGTNSSGAWVYAPTTNTLIVHPVPEGVGLSCVALVAAWLLRKRAAY